MSVWHNCEKKRLTVGMAVAIVATTAALAPATTPSENTLEKKRGLESAYTMDEFFWEVLKGTLSYHLAVCIIIALWPP